MNVDSRLPVGLLMVAIGLGMVVGTGAATYVLQMTVAEPVEAEVLSTSVTTEACSVDESCRQRYVPDVTYRFTYEGEEYTGDQVFPDASSGGSVSRDVAASTASEYEAGDRVTVHVVPGRPDTAYLVGTGPNLAAAVFAIFGALLTLAGANGIRQGLLGIEPPGEFDFD